jgi:hypothetical protein
MSIRSLLESLLGASLSAIERPIGTTPWSTLATSAFLVLLRVLMILAGALVLAKGGFQCQNFIWIISHGIC